MANRQLHTLLGRLRKAAALPDGHGLTDAQLLERFVSQQDEAAFEALLWRHAPMVWAVGRRLLRREEDAEDAFQATFLVLVRKAGAIARREALGSWLYQVAYRVALRAQTRAAPRAEREQPVEDVPAPESTPAVVWRDLRPVLDEEVSRLPERYRAAFVLCYLEGRTNAEAAQELGCPVGTVLSRLAWARERLRRRLTRRGVTLSAGLLTAVLSQQTASAAVPTVLVGATVRAAVIVGFGPAMTGMIGEPVTALTEGVLRAMYLSKVKVAACLLVVASVLGSGIGLLAYQGLGAEPPSVSADAPSPPARPPAEPPPSPPVRPPREPAPDDGRPDQRAAELEKAVDVLRHLEAELQKREQKSADELIEARKQLVAAEEQVRLRERRQAAQREREQAELRAAEQHAQSSPDRVGELTDQLAKLRATATPGAPRPDEERLLRELRTATDLREKARLSLKELEARFDKWEQVRAEELIEARQEVVITEERVRLLERRQAAERERVQGQLQAVERRVQQRQGDLPRTEPAPGRVQELERKLDQLLREVTELRREIRRQPPDGGRTPPRP